MSFGGCAQEKYYCRFYYLSHYKDVNNKLCNILIPNGFSLEQQLRFCLKTYSKAPFSFTVHIFLRERFSSLDNDFQV